MNKVKLTLVIINFVTLIGTIIWFFTSPAWESGITAILSGVCFCMKCGNHMPGKSATGRNGKVPYYEHSWATKRNSTLTKKTFQCEPTRVQAKKAEFLVWSEFCKFIESQKFLIELQNKVKAIHKNIDEESERGKLKAKLYGVSSQLDALAERLSMLPKTVSATPIFKQMEKLELVKKGIGGKAFKDKRFEY